MIKKTFLVEIGTEELPPKSLRSLAESFSNNFASELNNACLIHGAIEWFATPRRLALKVKSLVLSQPDREIEKRGPSIAKAFDSQGKPQKAAKEWAKSCGITISEADRLATDKGEWMVYRARIKGESTETLLPKLIISSLMKLSVFKMMRWGANNACFIRPVHTVTVLLGNKVLPVTLFGIKSDRIIFGHRFMGEARFTIDNADQYPQILLDRGKVIANYELRKSKIKNNIKREACKIKGTPDLNEGLLEEVVSLVEWPVVLSAKFEEKFLSIPKEALVHTMQTGQKCFPVYEDNGKLLPNFIFVANIESSDPKEVISGNQRVMHPRLTDASFFFSIDRKKRLEDNLPNLEFVLFQRQLGTLRDKTDRIVTLSKWVASKIGANINHVARAGLLSKCDLISKMVFEFTNIQGIMGMHYARYDGEEEDVAIALKEQYQPRFYGDQLPSNLVSCSLAIADKIDTLVGILGIGQSPKGDRDPFALRRIALGVLRIIVEKNLNLDLQTLTEEAVRLYNVKLTNKKVVGEVIDFILRRFPAYYLNNTSLDTIQAVLALRPTRPIDFKARIEAISHFRMSEESSGLTEVHKRISNILLKSKEAPNDIICTSILKEPEEIKLVANLVTLQKKLQSCLTAGLYRDALIEMASLREPIDGFFKTVMVNDSNKEVRINRLTILSKLRELFLQVADISLLR